MSTSDELLALKMTIPEALAFADEWSRGMTVHADSQGWRVVCMLLAAEVRNAQAKLRAELQQQALKHLTSEGQWMEQVGKLQADLQASRNACRGHDATVGRLQSDLVRAGLKLEASRLECERLKVAVLRSIYAKSITPANEDDHAFNAGVNSAYAAANRTFAMKKERT